MQGLYVIHKKNIIHRDLKPENIFLHQVNSQLVCKIGDFGLSRTLNNGRKFAMTFAGSPLYMAPELVQGVKYSNKVDIWSLGCILFELCSLKPLFEASELFKIMQNITTKDIPSLSSMYSPDLENFLNIMMNRDPNERPSVENLLEHRIFSKRILSYLFSTKI